MEQFLRPVRNMKKITVIIGFLMLAGDLYAQSGTSLIPDTPKVIVTKDPRLDILAKVEAELNGAAARFAKGYRLLVLKSDNRDFAMKVRAYLLQTFPEQKVIMTYQAPFKIRKFWRKGRS
jgi:hypothetical protein